MQQNVKVRVRKEAANPSTCHRTSVWHIAKGVAPSPCKDGKSKQRWKGAQTERTTRNVKFCFFL
eukprot:5720442-Amphidinium_carterae.1